MELKKYQRRVVDEVERFLSAVAAQRAGGNARHGSLDAWRDLGLPGRYTERENGLGEDLPTFCVKVPTGGGKTVLATQVLGLLYRSLLRERNGAGLVLWVVPSSAIYRDTLRRLRDRNDWYRIMLEHAVSRRLEIWEKHEINRLTPTRLVNNLNVLVVQLASTNRETKEQLKFFRDSGGNIVQHFPPEDDWEAQRELKEQVPNLDMIEDDPETGRHLAATSIGNLVRLCKPLVIVDEGHKATSDLARRTIEGFNATAVVELSATPVKDANVLVRVSGDELLDEQMIKLPINIATSGAKAWKNILTKARDKRIALASSAAEHAKATKTLDRVIRPIVLVQVERTGKDQRDGQKHVHTEDVRDYLMQRLDVPETAIAVKSSSRDDIEGIDLMDPDCPVEWIITKSALQEGWDCPFAYVLVSLNNTLSKRSMTQLVGRILRQPYQEKTGRDELDESYVYCRHATAAQVAKTVKSALEKEGYEGDLAGVVVDASRGTKKNERTVRIQPKFSKLYRKPFEGKIYLPHFCVRNGEEFEPLDYFRHLIAKVNVDAFRFDNVRNWPSIKEAQLAARDRFYRMTLGSEAERVRETEADLVETDEQVLGWIAASLSFEFLGPKETRRIVDRVFERMCKHEMFLKDRLTLAKFVVRDHIEDFTRGEVDHQTKAEFERLHGDGSLVFYLECHECRFEVPPSIEIRSSKPMRELVHDNGDRLERSLFDFIQEDATNQYERAVALALDRDERVLWWYRNLVRGQFYIQGHRKNRIRPDFVVQGGTEEKPEHRVVVLEAKGAHLEGNPDTLYKRDIAKVFNDVGNRVSWQQLGEDFEEHVFRFQILDEAQEFGRDWEDDLHEVLQCARVGTPRK